MTHIAEVVNPPDFLTGAIANLSGQAADPFKIPPGTATRHARAAMMLDRLTRIQLMIFAVVTVLTVGAITIFYLRLPARSASAPIRWTRISSRVAVSTRTPT